MKSIYKYNLEFTGSQIIEIPINSHILDIQFQKGKLVMWAFVDTEEKCVDVITFDIVGTGHNADRINQHRYLKTLQEEEGKISLDIFYSRKMKPIVLGSI